MKSKIFSLLLITTTLMSVLSIDSFADHTSLGNITKVIGHSTRNCAVVKHSDGMQFRIKWDSDVEGAQMIFNTAMAALLSGKKTKIMYTPGVTSGCGTENKIITIELYN